MIYKLDAETMSETALGAMLQRFFGTDRPHRESLYEYYRGAQGVNKGRVAPGRPDNALIANFAKYISDVHTGYFLGIPPTYEFAARRTQERVLRAMRAAELDSVLFAAARDMSICGQGFALTYMTADGPRCVRLDPLETFVAHAPGVAGEVAAAVRVAPLRRGQCVGEVYEPGLVRRFSYDGRHVSFGEQSVLPLKTLAVSHFLNNQNGVGDFEPVTSLIDAYNLLLSGAMDDMQSVANAFLALYGMQGTTRDDIDRANITRILSLSENGKAEFIVKHIDPEAMQLMKKTLLDDMLLITMTPNLNDEAFGIGSSGVALEYKLWGAEQARSAKERGFSPGARHIVTLLYESLNLLGLSAAGDFHIRFFKNLPQDLSKIVANAEKLTGLVSKHTLLELLPFIPDVERELDRVELEKQDGHEPNVNH